MKKGHSILLICLIGALVINALPSVPLNVDDVILQLEKKHGEEQADRIARGVKQVARFWREGDGTSEDFAQFCLAQFIVDPIALQETFERFERNLEQIYGLNTIMSRELKSQIVVDIGSIRPVDMLFAEFNPFAHLNDDFFKTKIAFAALLNFPLFTLEERLQLGPKWSREQWAQARLVQQFARRVPSDVQQKISQAFVKADYYISHYNIHMHHLLTPKGERYFPEGLKLIIHWGLRDELKAQYANPDGFKRQKVIQKVMERIIKQEIPAVVIDNPAVDWDPENNAVKAATAKGESIAPEDNIRYQHLLEIFRGQRLVDPYFPDMPTLMDRRFQENREIPEKDFEALLISIVDAPVAKKVGKLIQKRLGRKLEPFDIWYDGFKARRTLDESKLDKIVSERYPTPSAFQADLPAILGRLGFDSDAAKFLSTKITIDPSRGVGHAAGAVLRSDNAHLRTRIPATGMNYKGFNIAIHELGHNVEQVLSLNRMDYVLLNGVPNTAFTEGFAFVFQSRDLDVLGIKHEDPQLESLKVLDNYWSTFEISGVALVDMYVWRWMYEHPEASPADLNQAVQAIAKEVWNRYYAPVFGIKDQILLGIYSHMISSALYLPDYPLGHIISFQIEQYFKTKDLAKEMERMCRLGNITPEAWMQAAIGASISTEPLIKATEAAMDAME